MLCLIMSILSFMMIYQLIRTRISRLRLYQMNPIKIIPIVMKLRDAMEIYAIRRGITAIIHPIILFRERGQGHGVCAGALTL